MECQGQETDKNEATQPELSGEPALVWSWGHPRVGAGSRYLMDRGKTGQSSQGEKIIRRGKVDIGGGGESRGHRNPETVITPGPRGGGTKDDLLGNKAGGGGVGVPLVG